MLCNIVIGVVIFSLILELDKTLAAMLYKHAPSGTGSKLYCIHVFLQKETTHFLYCALTLIKDDSYGYYFFIYLQHRCPACVKVVYTSFSGLLPYQIMS